MKLHKIELCIVDFEDQGATRIVREINCRTDNILRCTSTETVDIGEWEDSHPLNFSSTTNEQFLQYFVGNKNESK